MLEKKDTYEETCAALKWDIPENFYIWVDFWDSRGEAGAGAGGGFGGGWSRVRGGLEGGVKC